MEEGVPRCEQARQPERSNSFRRGRIHNIHEEAQPNRRAREACKELLLVQHCRRMQAPRNRSTQPHNPCTLDSTSSNPTGSWQASRLWDCQQRLTEGVLLCRNVPNGHATAKEGCQQNVSHKESVMSIQIRSMLQGIHAPAR